MTITTTRRTMLASAAALCWAWPLAAIAQQPGSEARSTDGTIIVQQTWTRATPNGAKVAGGFLTVTNKGTEPDQLIGGSADIAGRIEIHEMAMADGVMKMRELSKGLTIAPGASVELKPGGFHIMFMDIKQPAVEGGAIKGTLLFQRAGAVEVVYTVRPLGAAADAHKTHK